MDILKCINYKIQAPTSLDFLKVYLKDVLDIGVPGKTKSPVTLDKNELKKNEKLCLKVLIEKMSIYLAKMSLHDYELAGKKPSL